MSVSNTSIVTKLPKYVHNSEFYFWDNWAELSHFHFLNSEFDIWDNWAEKSHFHFLNSDFWI